MTQNSVELNSAAVSDRGLSKKRPQNEDSYLELPGRGLFVVADGVGGAQAGDVASQMAVEILGEAFANLRPGGDSEELMKTAIERANSAIYQMSHDLPQLSMMATTVVALHIDGNIATIGHVGDSRLYRLDAGGNLFRETQDHSVVEDEVLAGRMTPEQAANHPSKNVINRALGAELAVEVDLKTIMFERGAKFLLCSDGITRHISDTEISELLASNNSPAQICSLMKDICYSRGAEDNLTAVIVSTIQNSIADSADSEENTVTAIRPPLAGKAVFADSDAGLEETPTQNLIIPGQDGFQNGKAAPAPQFSVPVNPADNNSENLPKENAIQPSSAATNSSEVVREEKNYTAAENNGGRFLGKALSSLLLLILGGILGATLYHLLKPQSQTVQQTQQAAPSPVPNITYSAFEDKRRSVDRSPSEFIAANSITAVDSEDFYLLGRAYLLSAKYTEAKEAFNRAKQNLPAISGENKQVLADEIAIGLSIVDSAESRRVLETEKSAFDQNAPNNANTNFNASTEILPQNANTPIAP